MSANKPQPRIAPLAVRPRKDRAQPKGLPVINLSFNELPFAPVGTVQKVIETVAKQAQNYGDPGCVALRTKLAEIYRLNPDQLICGNGSEELLDIIGRAFLAAGDECLISEFGYIQFPIVSNRVGATLVKAPEQNYVTDVDALLDNISERTKLIFLANPNNPTGSFLQTREVQRLAQSIPSSVVLVIDTAYGEFVDAKVNGENTQAMHELVTQHENVIVTQTFSKAFGIAGLRAGWCHVPTWMLPLLNTVRAMGPVNAIAQAAATAVLDEIELIDQRITTIVSERNRLVDSLQQMPFEVIATRANFIMCSPIQKNAQSDQQGLNPERYAVLLADYLFDNTGIVVNLAREAGLERFIRFSISTAETNDRLIDCISDFCQQ